MPFFYSFAAMPLAIMGVMRGARRNFIVTFLPDVAKRRQFSASSNAR
jgi:hypothetical protein